METRSITGNLLFEQLMKETQTPCLNLNPNPHVGLMWHELPPWILERIFTHIRYNTSLSSGKDELARLATVCKPWSEAALSLLWAQCNDLTQLLRTVPTHILRSSQENGVLVSRNPGTIGA
jgi:hypothetical protein